MCNNKRQDPNSRLCRGILNPEYFSRDLIRFIRVYDVMMTQIDHASQHHIRFCWNRLGSLD